MNLDDETLTIGELKDMLTMRFPGGPPRSVQRLFLGSRLLKDDEPASSLREDEEEDDEEQTRTALTLDVVPPVADMDLDLPSSGDPSAVVAARVASTRDWPSPARAPPPRSRPPPHG